jgi:hypothetical protein
MGAALRQSDPFITLLALVSIRAARNWSSALSTGLRYASPEQVACGG